MAKWQPPIPAGALYSKAARKLGPALPLLAYCYDKVGSDGWFTLSLKAEATGDLDEAYPTIKRWWQSLEAGPFFAEVQKHGRNGMRVRFKDVWLDWRILKARDTGTPFGTDTGSKVISNTPIEITNGIINGTDTGSVLISQNNVYGTHDSDQAVFADAADAAPRERTGKRKTPDRTPEQQVYLDRKKAIETAYVAALGYKPAAFAAEAKAAKWLAEQGYTAEQVVGCYEHLRADSFYDKKHIRLQTVANQIGAWLHTNRQRPARASPNIPLIQAPPANAKPKLSAEETRAILAEYNPRFRT